MRIEEGRVIVKDAAGRLGRHFTLELARAGIPLGRFGTPQEIWLALKFIIECDYFTGRVIEVDGGSNF